MTRLDDLLGNWRTASPVPAASRCTLTSSPRTRSRPASVRRCTSKRSTRCAARWAVFSAHMSAGNDWSASVPLYCNAPGPDSMDICLERFGHDGRHRGPGSTEACEGLPNGHTRRRTCAAPCRAVHKTHITERKPMNGDWVGGRSVAPMSGCHGMVVDRYATLTCGRDRRWRPESPRAGRYRHVVVGPGSQRE